MDERHAVDVRLECLRQAIKAMETRGGTADDIVTAAQKFEDFVVKQDKNPTPLSPEQP